MKLSQKNINELIEKFIDMKNYKSRKDVLGVFFYGSSLYGKNTDGSDIDMHIIVKSKNDVRGNMMFDGVRMEYFERPYRKIIEQMKYEKSTNQTVILSMLGYGKIIYEKHGTLTKLQNKVKKYYHGYEPKPLISKQKALYDFYKIYLNINRLEKLSESGDSVFYFMYFMFLNNIKKVYEKYKGLSTDISQYKLKRFYLNNAEQDNTFKTIPDEEFISLFLACVEQRTPQAKVTAIRKLFNHCTRDFDFDFASKNILLERK